MRIFITTVLLLGLSVCAVAADLPYLDEKTITSFIEVFPQYKEILARYGENVNELNVVPTMSKAKDELDALCKKYNMSMEEFSLLTQKITTGLTVIKLEEQNMSHMLQGLQQLSTASEEELKTLKSYLPKIEKLFEN